VQDSSNLREALKYSAQMLVELRTSKLSPQKYYELCILFRCLRTTLFPSSILGCDAQMYASTVWLIVSKNGFLMKHCPFPFPDAAISALET
jgi:hypothetical protein